MTLTRRAFLQQISLALAAAGISQADFGVLTRRYQQALAQPTRRKLALLVGINQYPEQVSDYGELRNTRSSLRGTTLNGCLTDVELQRELLIHRFGFQPSDIVTLLDQQATRQAIESAFLEHLTAQARPGDVVVFHFSGLGSRVQLGNEATMLQNSLVPVDGWLPTEQNPTINDLLEETLGLLVRSLATDQVTTVLDMSYGDPGRLLQGNWRVRSRPSTPNGQPNAEELALQERLMSQHRSSSQHLSLPGIVLTAASAGQGAIEGQWNGFSAGLFTYALTQQLWWATPSTPLWVSLNRSKAIVKQWVGDEQQPQLNIQNNREQPLPYYTHPLSPEADGVVIATEEDGKVLQLWLAGLPPDVLEHYGTNSLLTLSGTAADLSFDASLLSDSTTVESNAPRLQVRSREGLLFKAKAEGAMIPNAIGQRVQEQVRLLPRNISLTVALDSTLERIERVDATSAFAGLTPKVAIVTTTEQPADYIFGKVQASRTLTAALPSETVPDANAIPATKGGYGLFNLGRVAVPNTIASNEEAVKTAVSRIAPHLKTLLGTKLLRLTANRGSSRLGVRVSLERVTPQPQVLFQQETSRLPSHEKFAFRNNAEMGEINLSSTDSIRYRLYNYSDRPVYALLLSMDSGGNALALNGIDAASSGIVVSPQETLTLPQGAIAADWTMQTPGGLTESWVICSRRPFMQASAILEADKLPNSSRQVSVLSNWLDLAQAILQDLHEASLTTTQDAPDSYALEVSAWAAFNVIYRVTAI